MFFIVFAASAEPLDTKGRAATWKKNRRQLVRVKLCNINNIIILSWLIVNLNIWCPTSWDGTTCHQEKISTKLAFFKGLHLVLCQNPTLFRILPLPFSLFFLLLPASWPLAYVVVNAPDPDCGLSVTMFD